MIRDDDCIAVILRTLQDSPRLSYIGNEPFLRTASTEMEPDERRARRDAFLTHRLLRGVFFGAEEDWYLPVAGNVCAGYTFGRAWLARALNHTTAGILVEPCQTPPQRREGWNSDLAAVSRIQAQESGVLSHATTRDGSERVGQLGQRRITSSSRGHAMASLASSA